MKEKALGTKLKKTGFANKTVLNGMTTTFGRGATKVRTAGHDTKLMIIPHGWKGGTDLKKCGTTCMSDEEFEGRHLKKVRHLTKRTHGVMCHTPRRNQHHRSCYDSSNSLFPTFFGEAQSREQACRHNRCLIGILVQASTTTLLLPHSDYLQALDQSPKQMLSIIPHRHLSSYRLLTDQRLRI